MHSEERMSKSGWPFYREPGVLGTGMVHRLKMVREELCPSSGCGNKRPLVRTQRDPALMDSS